MAIASFNKGWTCCCPSRTNVTSCCDTLDRATEYSAGNPLRSQVMIINGKLREAHKVDQRIRKEIREFLEHRGCRCDDDLQQRAA